MSSRCSVACAFLLLALAVSRAAETCTCTGKPNNRVAVARADYGTFCASWDAADEDAWCAVGSATACGKDNTFENDNGFWSHEPCRRAGVMPGFRPPPPPPAAAEEMKAEAAAATAGATLVIARHSEKLGWLTPKLAALFRPVVIVQKNSALNQKLGKKLPMDNTRDTDGSVPELPSAVRARMRVTRMPNSAGRECDAYLRYILDEWDRLPDVMVFVHGHGPHGPGMAQPRTLAKHVAALAAGGAWATAGFLPLMQSLEPGYGGCFLRCQGAPDEQFVKLCPRRKAQMLRVGFGAAEAEELSPRCVLMHCCAEFAVTRARVRARPRAYYEKLLRLVYSEEADGCREWCHSLEHLWHVVFGRPALNDPAACSARVRVAPAIDAAYGDALRGALGSRYALEAGRG
eukprot:g6766.t1